MLRRAVIALFLFAALLSAQKYKGPRPPKPDIPYLLHASALVPTEIAEATEQQRKDEIAYSIPGAASPARTPLASPIFLIQAEKINPERLELYKLVSKGGQREAVFSKKKRGESQALRISVTNLGESIYRIEAYDSLAIGEYSLTPSGSNQVFCFQVY